MKDYHLINLQSIIDLSTKLNEYDSDEKILNSTVLTLMGKIKFSKSFVLFPSDDKYKLIKHRSGNINHIKKFSIDSIIKINNDISEELESEGIEICIPLFIDNLLKYVLCFGKRLSDVELTEEEYRYMNLVSGICTGALKNASNFDKLIKKQKETDKKNQLLRTILEISKDFNYFISEERILKLLSFHLMGQLTITKFILYEKSEGKIILKVNKFSDNPSDVCINSLFEISKTTKLNDYNLCVRLKEGFPNLQYAIPMQIKGITKGMLLVGKKMNGEVFTPDNLVFLESLANIAVAAIENVRLIKEEIAKRQLETEMNYAKEIQEKLLPKTIISPVNYDIFGKSIPSRQVGGDYFDIIRLSEDKTIIAVADVSGKGVAASLIMSNLQAGLKVTSERYENLLDTVSVLNKLIFSNTDADKFVTLFIGILDSRLNTFEYINAGHNPAVFISGDEYKMLGASGLILGFDEICDDYTIEKITFKKNDSLFIYTDGVNEAQNINKEDFSEKRLIRKLFEYKDLKSKEVLNNIFDDVKRFTENAEQYDDITMLALKRID
jgi:sigma-B regulation protein RsbU (phosphoserine phosphatase)